MADKKITSKKSVKTKRIIIIAVIAVIVVALIVVAAYFLNIQKYKKYEQYEAKMHMYGFDSMYDNGSAKSSQKVTQAEALKVVIAAVTNKADISSYVNTDKTYKDAQWVELAKQKVIFRDDTVTEKNINSRASYINIIEYLANAKAKFLDMELSRNVDAKMKNFDKYDKYEQRAILDLIANSIIDNTDKNLDGNRKIAKGELNELVIKFVEKYNIISNGQPVVTDSTKLPTNTNDYPYIVENVEKQVYEQPFYNEFEDTKKTPSEMYRFRKESYGTVKDIVEGYYTKLLNVDYNTITKESFISDMYAYALSEIPDEYAQSYVDYVKQHKIQITGNATVQMPVMYNDGYFVRVRTKLEFEIKNSDTKENLLFMDLTNPSAKYIYENNKYTIYIDAKLSNSAFSLDLFNERSVISELLIDMSKNDIKTEQVGE